MEEINHQYSKTSRKLAIGRGIQFFVNQLAVLYKMIKKR